jgi:hypothetical protein
MYNFIYKIFFKKKDKFIFNIIYTLQFNFKYKLKDIFKFKFIFKNKFKNIFKFIKGFNYKL